MKAAKESLGGVADALLAACVVLPPLLGGTVRGGTWAMAFGLAVLAAGVSLLATEAPPRPSRWIVAVGGVWGASLLVSLVPLPGAFVDSLSSGAAWVSTLPGAEPSAFRALHQAPGEGALHLLIWATASLVAVAASLRFSYGRGRRRFRRAVVVAGLLAFGVCMLWTAFEGRGSFGLYPRPKPGGRWMSPLVNPNHWAAWLSMVTAYALGFGLDDRVRWTRVGPALLIASVSIGMVALSHSRSGLIGLAVTLGVLGLVWARGPAGEWPRRRMLGLAGASLVSLVPLAAGLRAGTHITRDRISGTLAGGLADEGRILLLPDAIDVLQAHLWLGTGRGAVADVLLRMQDVQSTTLRHWVEVLPLDLLLDHGLLFGVPLLGLLVGTVFVALRRGITEPGAAGAGAALVGLAVHELADFSTFGGAVLLLAICSACLALGSSGVGRRSVWAVVVGFALVAGLLSMSTAMRHGDSRRCYERLLVEQPDAAGVAAFAATEQPWHPASGALALEIGAQAYQQGDGALALKWLNRAQLLAPTHPEPHLWTARLLVAGGFDSQAAIEYRLAAAGDWASRGREITLEVARTFDGVEALARLAPAEAPDGAGRVALWLHADDPVRAAAVARVALEQAPDRALTGLAYGNSLLSEGHRDEAAAAFQQAWGGSGSNDTIRAHIAAAMGRTGHLEEALEMARAAQQSAPDLSPTGWVTLGAYERKVGSHGAARAALRRAREFGVPRYTARAFCEEAILEGDRGDAARALELYLRGAEADPSWAQPLVWAADLHLEAGRDVAARRTLERAVQREPTHEAAVSTLSRLTNDG